MLIQTEGGIPKVECPHCKMIVELTAEVDSSYPVTGSVELLWANGEVAIIGIRWMQTLASNITALIVAKVWEHH